MSCIHSGTEANMIYRFFFFFLIFLSFLLLMSLFLCDGFERDESASYIDISLFFEVRILRSGYKKHKQK